MENEAKLIGEVIILQVQRISLKQGESGQRYYDPAGLLPVQEVLLSPKGVLGLRADGAQVVDAHHADHPETRFKGTNGISIGLTGHYDRMRRQFGAHLRDGIAGENMIIACDTLYAVDELAGTLVFENPDGTVCRMNNVRSMAPCDEFSHFAQQSAERLPAAVLKDTLQFLDDGTRGFALSLIETEGRIVLGAKITLLP